MHLVREVPIHPSMHPSIRRQHRLRYQLVGGIQSEAVQHRTTCRLWPSLARKSSPWRRVGSLLWLARESRRRGNTTSERHASSLPSMYRSCSGSCFLLLLLSLTLLSVVNVADDGGYRVAVVVYIACRHASSRMCAGFTVTNASRQPQECIHRGIYINARSAKLIIEHGGQNTLGYSSRQHRRREVDQEENTKIQHKTHVRWRSKVPAARRTSLPRVTSRQTS